jgi:alkanesulfonate monooxygenase SsuD/methylene tetrahydromethanopterin reductase-like flavin-dependent oxidoreductase (luciferase family)
LPDIGGGVARYLSDLRPDAVDFRPGLFLAGFGSRGQRLAGQVADRLARGLGLGLQAVRDGLIDVRTSMSTMAASLSDITLISRWCEAAMLSILRAWPTNT